jgi:hypothetical protein
VSRVVVREIGGTHADVGLEERAAGERGLEF